MQSKWIFYYFEGYPGMCIVINLNKVEIECSKGSENQELVLIKFRFKRNGNHIFLIYFKKIACISKLINTSVFH